MSESPAYYNHEEFQTRKQKLAEIRALGVNPYPHSFPPHPTCRALLDRLGEKKVGNYEQAAEGATEKAMIAGRIVLFRPMGKNAFIQLQDQTGRLQVLFNRDLSKVEGLSAESELSPIKFLEKKLDLGDIIGVEGHLFYTQTGELTLFAKKVTLLSKSLLPLPDKHSGLSDKGVLYRKRWLDLITHPESLSRFVIRSKVIQFVRQFLDKQGFLEVETPVLQNIYGGANARPFTTHLHALDQEMFLRISLEIPLKKLIVGGFEKIYELSKVFRNEGIDRTHNPEFTMLELYAAYWDYNDMMHLMETLFEQMALSLFGMTSISFERDNKQYTVNLKAPWKRLSMKESIQTYAGLSVDDLSEGQMRAYLKEKTSIDHKRIAEATRGELIAHLFEELVEEHLIQPHHIIDHPIETTPLCKLHRDPKLAKEKFVERFETFILGKEFSNAYTELNDPELQRELLEDQARKKLAGDEEAHPLDEEFIEALCQGMPPTGGLGIGIDRMVMLFTNAHSIRDILYFPIMRPEE